MFGWGTGNRIPIVRVKAGSNGPLYDTPIKWLQRVDFALPNDTA